MIFVGFGILTKGCSMFGFDIVGLGISMYLSVIIFVFKNVYRASSLHGTSSLKLTLGQGG